ncbi:MAG: N-acetyltransferase [Flavobacteriales bacterium]|nr:N-acetyltransferase [Flavobacteriales bacterium]
MSLQFERIENKDLQAVTAIYNHYVETSTATFHLEPVTTESMALSLSLNNDSYPSFVVLDDGQLAGFCYLSRFRPKQAYDISAEVTLYLHPDFIRKGIGSAVLAFLEEEAKKRNIKNLLGVITAENTASMKLFERCGYNQAARLKNIGIKFGKALDVVWYQKEL